MSIVAPARVIDHAAVQDAARDLLNAVGADVDSEGLEDTPRRVADAFAELLTPRPFRATAFPNDNGYDELIVARSIPFHSLCMHHLLPFHGTARRPEAGREDRHLSPSWRATRRPTHAPGVPVPDIEDQQ